MNLKWRYILFGICFLVSYAFLLYEILQVNKWYFLAGEIFLVGMIIFYIMLYNRLLRPIQAISSGIALLREKDFNTFMQKVGQKEVDGIIEVYNQMVNKLREEKIEKEEQNHFLDLLIHASPSGIIILDLEEKILQVNPAAVKLLGISAAENITGKTLNELNSQLGLELSKITDYRTDIIQLDGLHQYKVHKKYFMDKGLQRPFIMIEELTREWIKAEKQSYEKVIRMMSHEVNNTVGSINSVLGSIIGTYREGDDENEEVREALEVSIERNENMNRFMANFASVVRIPPPSKSEVALRSLVERIIVLYRAEAAKRNINLVSSFPDNEVIIEADQTLMEQVFTNIVKNSIESIEQHGEITFIVESDPPRLHILDNGKGIKEESLPHLFTPFYSEKKNGQGIGLTFVKEVLLAHHFSFRLQKNEKGLTDFFINFISY